MGKNHLLGSNSSGLFRKGIVKKTKLETPVIGMIEYDHALMVERELKSFPLSGTDGLFFECLASLEDFEFEISARIIVHFQLQAPLVVVRDGGKINLGRLIFGKRLDHDHVGCAPEPFIHWRHMILVAHGVHPLIILFRQERRLTGDHQLGTVTSRFVKSSSSAQ